MNNISLNKISWYAFLLVFVINNQVIAAVVIQSRINNGAWKKNNAIYPLKGQPVTLKVTKEPKTTIRWYQIVPDISKIYKNANHPWEKNAYQWVGFGKIDYERQELISFRDQWEIRPFEEGFDHDALSNSRFYQKEVGSFWFQVEMETGNQIKSSPGIEDADDRGLSPKVFRVSIRDGKGYLGYLTSFFNVPGLFGSTTYQSNHYIGVDCADVLVTAYGKWKGQPIKKNYNVAMLVNKLNKIKEFELIKGVPSQPLRWEKDIHAGDFIAVRYQGARQYQHIGALVNDANHNEILDENDRVIHAGPLPLHYSYLSDGNFEGHVVVLRPSTHF